MSSSINDVLWGVVLFSAAAGAGVVASNVWPDGVPIQQDGTSSMRFAAWALGPRHGGTLPPTTPLSAPPMLAPRVEVPEQDEDEFDPDRDLGELTAEASSPVRPWRTEPREPGERPRFTPSTVSPFWSNDAADDDAGEAQPPSVWLASSRADVPSEGDSLRELFDRIEQLGAVVVRLEKLPHSKGKHGKAAYHFRCEFPLGDGSPYHRFFQASDASPIQAVQRVLNEAEAWKNGPDRSRREPD